MNELRMYVEHLFEGKVLTSSTIELKEEIYGNLVARYEDLIDGGASPEEALSLTKQSMTSIDDVIVEEDEPAASGDSSLSAEAHEPSGAAVPTDLADSAAPHDDSAPCDPEPVSGEVDGVDAGPSACEVPCERATTNGSEKKNLKRTAMYVIAGFCMIVILSLAAKFLFGFVGGIEDAHEKHVEASSVEPSGSSAPAAPGASAQSVKDASIVVSPDGSVTMDGEPADELLQSVVKSGVGDILPFAETDLSDAPKVESLVRSLPLSEFAGDIDVSKGVDVLSLAYRDVPESYDGDSVDAALAYDVTTLFCAMPLVNEIQVTVTEKDEPMDESYYVFTRDDVQGRHGVRLDGELLNEAGWHQLKADNLYRRHFIERMIDAAEREWK